MARLSAFTIGAACVASMLTQAPASAQTPARPDSTSTKMVAAVQKNDYDGFVKDCDETFRKSMTKALLEKVNATFKARMEKGFTIEFLGELKQNSSRVILSKIVFADKGDDVLVKNVTTGGKVAGFWLQ